MTIAFLFPGQGVTRTGTAMRWVSASPKGRALLECAMTAAAIQPAQRRRAPRLLDDRTDVLQPVLTAISLHVVRLLAEAGIVPHVVLGHSLGELAAWSAAGGTTAEGAITIAALRGREMARAAEQDPGGMVAAATSDAAEIETLLAIGRRGGWMEIAAWNAPDETVFSGCERAVVAVLRESSVPVARVPTSGPWHTAAMDNAVEPLRKALRAAAQTPLSARFVTNRDGAVACDEDVPDLLAEQLRRPLDFRRALQTVCAHEKEDARALMIVTIGPGAVLRSLIRKNLGTSQPPRLFATDNEQALSETIATLGGLA